MAARKVETFPPVTLGHIRGHGCRDLLVGMEAIVTENIIDLEKQRQEAERRLRENPTDKRLDDINKILTWSSDMHRRGHMPDDVVRAFHEHFGEAYQA